VTTAPAATTYAEVPCPLCGGTDVATKLEDRAAGGPGKAPLMACTSLDHGVFGRIVQCRRCGLQFRSPREDEATILSWYGDVEDPVYLAQEPARVATFSSALDRLERRVPVRGPLVDLGCYTGVFLDVAAKRGWPVTGVEPSRWAGEVARRRGYTVYPGTVTTAPLPRRAFAVVTLWDVIEHLADPVRELELAREVARDDGWLVVSTLRVDCWIVRLLGRRWPWYMRMHLIYYSRETLRAVLAKAGWRMVALESYPHVVTLGYLARKVGAYAPWLGRALGATLRALSLAERKLAIDLGDCVTAYAVKAPPS
jgi:SAM-dependent methyltransferase